MGLRSRDAGSFPVHSSTVLINKDLRGAREKVLCPGGGLSSWLESAEIHGGLGLPPGAGLTCDRAMLTVTPSPRLCTALKKSVSSGLRDAFWPRGFAPRAFWGAPI